MPLPSFTVTGNLFDLLGDVAAGEIVGNGLGGATPAKVTFTSNVPAGSFVAWAGALYHVTEVVATVNADGTITRNGAPVQLLANDPGLSVDSLQWQVHAGKTKRFWFNAPTDNATVNLSTVAPVPGVSVVGVGAGAAPDATTTVKGIVQLAGDLAGTAAAPTVPGLTGKVATSRTVNGQPLTADVTVTKGDVGLGNVDNTSDAEKPVSTAQQAALSAAPSSRLRVASRGINITGAEHSDNPATLPGTYGTDYSYESATSLAYIAGRGHKIIRLPFKWERIQPTRNAALNTAELGRLQAAVSRIYAAGMTAILDVHNYARFKNSTANGGATLALGTDFTSSDLVDLWTRLSTAFKGNPGIYAYGLMNEPHDLTGGAAGWETASQALLTAIRNNGDTTMIMVPGYTWSGAHAWTTYHTNGSWITDPINNFRYEAHYYFDYSGTYTQTYATMDSAAVTAGYANLAARVTTEFSSWLGWLATNNVQGYLGEIGWPNGTNGTADTSSWDALGTLVYNLCDANNIDLTYFCAGERAQNDSMLTAYMGGNGDWPSLIPLATTQTPSVIVEAHKTRYGTAATGRVITATSTDTLSNKTLTSPVIANNDSIVDSLGKKIVQFATQTSAVNQLRIVNAPTGQDAFIDAQGTDTNVGINLNPKGSGTVKVGGVPVATTTSTQTLTTKTLTSPKIANNDFLADGNGNAFLVAGQTTSAVNQVKVTNAATTGAPSVAAQGTDTNVDLNLVSKGTGRVKINGAAAGLDFSATFADVSMTGSPAQTVTTGSFVKLNLNIEASDPGNNFDAVTNFTYTIPSTGIYEFFGLVRLTDSSTLDMNLAIGVATGAFDGAWVKWNPVKTTAFGSRTGYDYSRKVAATAGQTYILYIFNDSAGPVGVKAAQFTAIRIA